MPTKLPLKLQKLLLQFFDIMTNSYCQPKVKMSNVKLTGKTVNIKCTYGKELSSFQMTMYLKQLLSESGYSLSEFIVDQAHIEFKIGE